MELKPGAKLGPYEILSPIGAGGMGQVFKALDTRLGRAVAIKLLRCKGETDPGQRLRFLREARAASALNHPNIVVLHDISHEEGRDFLVMEHVPGQNLAELIPKDGMPIDSLFRLGEQVALALDAAHAAGIVHRDIKPANIMVTPADQVKILDFGIASMTSPAVFDTSGGVPTATQLTVPGMVMGTVSYMSPEQALGETLDGRSDIFSLGCVLYEAATGKLPFRGANALAVMQEMVKGHPAAPGSLRGELPYGFDQLIAACLESNPARRLASAADVAKALKSLSSSPGRPAAVTQAGRSAIAVIPFRFRTGAPEDQFLSLALAEAVVNRISSAGGFVVRPIASVLRYAGTDVEWSQVARELNVDVVVDGTIQKMGSRVRVLAQAVQVSDSKTLLSARQDGDMCDLFGLQDRLADAVFGILVSEPQASAEPAIPPTNNPLAYELYMRAVDRLAHWNRFDIDSAIGMLSRVVEIDPNFADAWGRLAQAYTQMGMHLDPGPQWFERAEHAIARTLELDPVQCDALCARGNIQWSPSRGFQNLAALRAMNAALKIDPSRYSARVFRCAIFFHLGFYGEAERDAEESLAANPHYALAMLSRAMVARYRGDYATAYEMYGRALVLDPALVHTNILGPMIPILLGRLEEARERIRTARQMVPEEPKVTCLEGLLATLEGNFALGEQLADQACAPNQRSLTHTHHTWHCAAGVYAICGQPEKAMVQLRQCAKMGLPNFHLFVTDPHLRALRDDPGFMALMSDLRREHDQYRLSANLIAPTGL